MKKHKNRTKIIATIGPASISKEVMERMIKHGVNVCRINASHGDHKMQQEIINNVRKLNKKLDVHVALLYDLQGPKLRIGDVINNSVILEENGEVELTIKECFSDHKKIFVKYPLFHNDIQVGDTVLIDDGKIELLIVKKNKKDSVIAKVIHGGALSSKKGLNLPYTKISLSSLGEKDKNDLEFALENEVEWIGLSFVRKADDVKELKNIIQSKGSRARVIAKIEKPEALRDIDDIIAATDGIMVARGDLGVEIAMEKVPLIQKMLVKKCSVASKPVIIATQMMESMITNYRPTRAETNDVANSVFDGADAVMLSGETSVGAYPVKVVEAMHKIIAMSEGEDSIYNRHLPPEKHSATFISDSICYNSCIMAEHSGAKAIIAMTHSGYTAFKISSQRPHAHVYIFTDNKVLLNTLSLVWGVEGFYYDKYISTDDTIKDIKNFLKRNGFLKKDDLTINVASTPLEDKGTANMIKLSVID
ncbi:MAG TPA: pyruvate kinase [Bacteroidia bacterium]|nr:pyruvate kinase [Bacteroidia bacterium]